MVGDEVAAARARQVQARAAAGARTRLRAAAEQAGGARVIVSVADVLAALGPTEGPPAGAARTVVLGLGDAERLAEAAWQTVPERIERHGHWHDCRDANRTATIEAARATLQHLLDGEAP